MSTPADASVPRRVEPVTARGSRWLWLLPALTFLVGLALGGLVLPDLGDEAVPAAAPAPDPTPASALEPSPERSDLLVRVPQPCLGLAEQSEEAVAVIDQFVEAARTFDARGMQQALDDVQGLRPRVEQLADDCRTRAGSDAVQGETVTSTPVPGASSTPSPASVPGTASSPSASSTPSPASTPSPTPTPTSSR